MKRYKRKYIEKDEKVKGIYVEFLNVDRSEDSYKEGEIGNRENIFSKKDIGMFKDGTSFWKGIEKYFVLPKNMNNFYAIEAGRITGVYQVNENNDLPSSSEENKWKKGEIKLYNVDMDIYIKFVEQVTPSEDEISKEFKIPKY